MISLDDPLKWTLTHAHYLQMGGYRLQCLLSERSYFRSIFGRTTTVTISGRERNVWEMPLSFELLKFAINAGHIDVPFVSADEIQRKSGRDALSKAIAMVQLTWFIIQIVGRMRQSLAVTELELATAAVASLNIVMYILWWSKPTDIQFPTVIMSKALQYKTGQWMLAHPSSPPVDCFALSYISISPPTGAQYTDQARDPIPGSHKLGRNAEECSDVNNIHYVRLIGDIEKVDLETHLWTETMNALRRLVCKLGTNLLHCYRSSDRNAHKRLFATIRWSISLLWRTIIHLFLALGYFPFLAILYVGNQTIPMRSDTDAERPLVEDMPVAQLMLNKRDLRFAVKMIFFCEDIAHESFLCLSALSGAFFGMIHCLAWNAKFPSYIEQTLWRTFSSIATGSCICIMVPAFVSIIIQFHHQSAYTTPFSSVEKLYIVPGICFALSRLSLLVVSIVGLRDLPSSAYKTVEWLEFFPHI